MWVHVLQDAILTADQEVDVVKNARLRATITADQDVVISAIKNVRVVAVEHAKIRVIIDVTEFANLTLIFHF